MRHDDLIQNSPEWYAFRESRLGASDAPIICGISPYKTAHQLWLEKTKRVERPIAKSNFAMERGHYLEPIVRGLVGFNQDKTYYPAVFTDDDLPIMMASMDGLDDDGEEAIEIKYAAKADHAALDENNPKSIPMKYYPQVQHQLHISKVKRILYCSYSINFKTEKDHTKGSLKIVPVFRDDEFLSKYIPAVEAFQKSIINGTPPELVIIRP